MENNSIEQAQDLIVAAIREKIDTTREMFMLQPYADGWLIHIYNRDTNRHRTTVGGETLAAAINKIN